MMSTVQRAREIAILAHEGQEYHSGVSYFIGHVEEVAALVHTDDEKMVAYLHDVIEDSTWSHSDLTKEGFASHILSAIMRLTHNKNKHSYTEYICGVAKDSLSRTVKLADLTVNMRTIDEMNTKVHLYDKYEAARSLLREADNLDYVINEAKRLSAGR